MNTYEITFTRENGSTGKDRVTAANEKQARQLGLITEERRQELYEKAKEMKP